MELAGPGRHLVEGAVQSREGGCAVSWAGLGQSGWTWAGGTLVGGLQCPTSVMVIGRWSEEEVGVEVPGGQGSSSHTQRFIFL